MRVSYVNVRALALVSVVAAAATIAVARGSTVAQSGHGRIPPPAAPPPVPPELLSPLRGPLRVTVRAVRFRTTSGARVQLERADILANAAAVLNRAEPITIESVTLVGLRVVLPQPALARDAVRRSTRTARDSTTPQGSGNAQWLDGVFAPVPGPRLRVGRVVVRDGSAGARAASGSNVPWRWQLRDADLLLTDVSLGGPVDRLRVVRGAAAGTYEGRPLRLTALTAAVSRTADRARAEADIALSASRIGVRGQLDRGDGYQLALVADTVSFADARALAPALPEHGFASVRATIAGGEDRARIVLEHAAARWGDSRVTAHGALTTGPEGAVDDVAFDIPRLSSRDLARIANLDTQSAAVWTGTVHADGPLREGVRIRGALEQREPEVAAVAPRLELNGSVKFEPRTSVDLGLRGYSLPLFGARLSARVIARGPVDSLVVTADVTPETASTAGRTVARVDSAAMPPPARNQSSSGAGLLDRWFAAAAPDLHAEALIVDPPGSGPRRLQASARLRSTAATGDSGAAPLLVNASGSVELAEDGALDVHGDIASLPLAALPLPAALSDPRGGATGTVTLTGTTDHPDLAGRLALRGVGFTVRSLNLPVRALSGDIVIADGVARFDSIAGTSGGGTIALSGRVRLSGERRVDAELAVDRVALIADSVAPVLVTAHLSAAGPLDSVRVRGQAGMRGGRDARLTLAHARGEALLGRDGTVEVAIALDSLPLAALPSPSLVRDLRGVVRGDLNVAGAIAEPRFNGVLSLDSVGAIVQRTGTELNGLDGTIRLEDGVARIERLRGAVGGGALSVTGEARVVGGPQRLALDLKLDSGLVVRMDSARVVASADLRLRGTPAAPRIEGSVALVDGWIEEDNFNRVPPIDPADPPYADLVERVPWPARSRLRRPEARQGPGATARVQVHIAPGMSIVDEDSDLHGPGDVLVRVDSGGARLEGIYRIEGGFYAQYGVIFDLVGGAFRFLGTGLEPRVSLRSDLRQDEPRGSGFGPGPEPLDGYPSPDFFAFGTGTQEERVVRRLSLTPETLTELAGLLLYDVEPQPVTGFRYPRFWLQDDAGAVVGPRAATQSVALIGGYLANELYDYLPVGTTSFRSGVVSVGSPYPARITVGPYVQGRTRLGPIEALVTQPTVGGAAPGLRLRLRFGGAELAVFDEPYFLSAAAVGETRSGFMLKRRTGIGIRWSSR